MWVLRLEYLILSVVHSVDLGYKHSKLAFSYT